MKHKLAALAVLVVGVCAVGSTFASQDAQAFAWKDTCKIFVVNRVAQSDVRPIGLLQVPPNPISYATYTALIATGFPTNTKVMFATTGFPVTAGCSAVLHINNPGSNVTCTAVAPTVGANTFRCDGNSTYVKEVDNDDIEGTVYIGGRASPGEPEAMSQLTGSASPFDNPGVPKAKTPTGALKIGQLAGGGWRKTDQVAELGQFGKLLEASNPAGKCGNGNDKSEVKPISGGGSLFVRGKNGAEAIGEFDGRYASAGQAEATLKAATSQSSIRCLAAALTAPGYKATVAAQGPNFGQGGIVTHRVVVKKNGGGFVGYVDVVGLATGRSNTVLVFFNRAKPAEVGQEEEVLASVAGDLKP